ncbi:MAG TPA: hypothetical protein VLZ78_06130 [Terrimesophilobacter sp.]|nr:hypothetical protein [Terrimesophilobacter sp.]
MRGPRKLTPQLQAEWNRRLRASGFVDIEANARHSGWTFHVRDGITSLGIDQSGWKFDRDRSMRMMSLSDSPVAQAWQAISAAVVSLPRNYRYRAFLIDWAVPVDGRDSGHGIVNRAARKHGLAHNTAAKVVRRFLRERGLPVPRSWSRAS